MKFIIIFILTLIGIDDIYGQNNIAIEKQVDTIPSFLKKQRKQIIGTWVGEQDKSWKWKFTKDGKLFEWLGKEPVTVYNYRIINKAPYCDIQIDTVEMYPEYSVLEIDNSSDNNDCYCYILNNAKEVLSLSPIYNGGVMIMVRPKKKGVHLLKK